MTPAPIPFDERRICGRYRRGPMGQCLGCTLSANTGPGYFTPRIELMRQDRTTDALVCQDRRGDGVVAEAGAQLVQEA